MEMLKSNENPSKRIDSESAFIPEGAAALDRRTLE
jgi:hypothetical protein